MDNRDEEFRAVPKSDWEALRKLVDVLAEEGRRVELEKLAASFEPRCEARELTPIEQGIAAAEARFATSSECDEVAVEHALTLTLGGVHPQLDQALVELRRMQRKYFATACMYGAAVIALVFHVVFIVHEYVVVSTLELVMAVVCAVVSRAHQTVVYRASLSLAATDTHPVTLTTGDRIRVVAAEVIGTISTSRAWNSKHLDADRIRLDLGEEMRQISASAEQLDKLDALLASVGGDDSGSSAVTATVQEYREMRDEARDTVMRRVGALYAYRTGLAEVEQLLIDIDRTAAIEVMSGEFAEVFTTIARDGMAADRTAGLVTELGDLRNRLEAELAFLSGDVIDGADLTRKAIA